MASAQRKSANPGTSLAGENSIRCVSSIATAVGSGIANCPLDGLARDSDDLRRAQIIGKFGCRGRTAPRHLFKSGDNVVKFSGVARQPFRENLQIGNAALQRLRVVSQYRTDPAQRIAGGLGHALARPQFGNQRRTSPEFTSNMPPSSAITGTPVKP
jgi:hypothetical protein